MISQTKIIKLSETEKSIIASEIQNLDEKTFMDFLSVDVSAGDMHHNIVTLGVEDVIWCSEILAKEMERRNIPYRQQNSNRTINCLAVIRDRISDSV